MVITIGLASSARAEIRVGESLDWLAIARPHIAIVEVTASDPQNTTEAKWTDLTIKTRLKKVLKGQPPKNAEFVRMWQMSARPGEKDDARPENGTEYLLFFDEQRKVTNVINLTFPSQMHGGEGADHRDVVLSTGFDIYKTRDAILQTLDHRLSQILKNPPRLPVASNAANVFTPEHGFKRVEVPFDKPAWNVLYGGSRCYLVIPDDTGPAKDRM